MIEFQNISFGFDDKELFRNVNVSINDGDRIALIGDNGSGKTTFLELLRGTVIPTDGNIIRTKVIIGYVKQDISKDVLVKDMFDMVDEWRMLWALSLVGLDETVVYRNFCEISGGQATKVSIASVLAMENEPNLLIFDEPTNNLDIQSNDWLVAFLKNYKGAVLAVSHDRSFINAFATKTWSIEDTAVHQQNGNYDVYKNEKNAALELNKEVYDRNQKEKKKLNELLVHERNIASGAKKKPAKDNDKYIRNGKFQWSQRTASKEIRRLKLRIEDVSSYEKIYVDKIYGTSIKSGDYSGDVIVSCEDITKKIGETQILAPVSFTVNSGSRVYVSGRNGVGKSTLLSIISGRLPFYDGKLKIAKNIKIGYFSQDVYGIDANETVMDVLSDYFDDVSEIYKQCRTLGLTILDVHKTIDNLSRGQQAKIGFVCLLAGRYDVLILDEPTNHLDITTREIIESALKRYDGTIIYSSHDKTFVDEIGFDLNINLDRE